MAFVRPFPTATQKTDPHDRGAVIGASVEVIAQPPLALSDDTRDRLAKASIRSYNPSYTRVKLTELGRLGDAQHLLVEAQATVGADVFLTAYVAKLGGYATALENGDAAELAAVLEPAEQVN